MAIFFDTSLIPLKNHFKSRQIRRDFPFASLIFPTRFHLMPDCSDLPGLTTLKLHEQADIFCANIVETEG
jgi:hypothetical protein